MLQYSHCLTLFWALTNYPGIGMKAQGPVTFGYEGGQRQRKRFSEETRMEVQGQLTKALRDLHCSNGCQSLVSV